MSFRYVGITISKTRTFTPRSRSLSTTWDPMNPDPPVTNTLMNSILRNQACNKEEHTNGFLRSIRHWGNYPDSRATDGKAHHRPCRLISRSVRKRCIYKVQISSHQADELSSQTACQNGGARLHSSML